MNAATGPITSVNVAYLLSTRELAGDERLSATDEAVNREHRGNLPAVYGFMQVHNSLVSSGDLALPGVNLSAIVYDDDIPLRTFDDLPAPMLHHPSSGLMAARDQKNSAISRLGEEHGETARLISDYKAARHEFESGLVRLLHEHEVDVVLMDRFMVILGKDFLDSYLAAAINSHPALLPDLPGGTPTADALERARSGGNPWTGATAHFINRGIDTGPPICQRESVFISQGMGKEDVRRENYRYEGANLWNGLLTYLQNPEAMELLSIRRGARRAHGNSSSQCVDPREARAAARRLMRSHRDAFSAFYSNGARNLLGTGKYSYRAPFGPNAPRAQLSVGLARAAR
jgi:folate-dependent phosphoribosylglycinamide formyltransferase PurN